MICQRCNTEMCFGPDTKSCSDQIVLSLKARILELEDLGTTKGFWGRACARLLSTNRNLLKERNAYRRFFENMMFTLHSFQTKMTVRYGVQFSDGIEEFDCVHAVSRAIEQLVALGNRVRHAETPQERYDAANAWDNHLLRFNCEINSDKRGA